LTVIIFGLIEFWLAFRSN